MRRCALLAIGLTVLWLSQVGLVLAKPPEGLSIDVEVGYDDLIQVGRMNPITVEMDNNRPDLNISGELVLTYNGVEYVVPCELPYPSRKQFYIYFPCDAWPPVLRLTVRSKAYTEEFSLQNEFRPIEAEDVSVVVLTRRPGSLNVIHKLPVGSAYRNLYTSQSAELGAGQVYVSYHDLDEVDPNPKYFDRADLIVIQDVDYTQVSPELVEALKASVSGGANVLFSLGQYGMSLAGSPLQQLCPLKVKNTQTITDLGDLGLRYSILTAEAPAVFAVGDLSPAAEVVSWAGGGIPAIVQQQSGSGKVTAIAFDYATAPFKQDSKLQPLFVDYMLGVKESVDVTDWYVHPQLIKNELVKLAEADPMSPGFVLMFLLIYIALIGPLNFFVLSRLKRRTFVWVTIPVIIVAFAWFGLRTGYFYRGSDNVTAYFQEMHLYPGAEYVPYQTVMLVFTAERTRYELEVPDRSAYIVADLPMVVDGYSYGGGGGGFRGMSGEKIDNSRNPKIQITQGKWTDNEYMYQGYYALDASVSTHDLQLERGMDLTMAQGQFTLDLPFDLESVEILGRGKRYAINHLPGQGTYSLNNLPTEGTSNLSADNYLANARSEFQSSLRASTSFGLSYQDEILVVGFTEELPVPAKFERPNVSYNLSMVVVHLPYTAVIPTQGRPAVSSRWLIGGANFEVIKDSRYGGNGGDRAEYHILKDGYLDLAFEVSGQVASSDVLDLEVSEVFDRVGGEVTTNPRDWIAVEVLSGGVWRPVNLPAGQIHLEIPIHGSITDQLVKVRIRALQECSYKLGDVGIY